MLSSEYNRCVEELRLAGLLGKNSDYDGEIGKSVIELLRVFGKQGHSGFSAQHTSTIFYNLVNGKILSPLTGEDNEWADVEEGVKQNKRHSAVFKEGNKSYYLYGKIYRCKDGSCYTDKTSSIDITFPYTPVSEYIDVDE